MTNYIPNKREIRHLYFTKKYILLFELVCQILQSKSRVPPGGSFFKVGRLITVDFHRLDNVFKLQDSLTLYYKPTPKNN